MADNMSEWANSSIRRLPWASVSFRGHPWAPESFFGWVMEVGELLGKRGGERLKWKMLGRSWAISSFRQLPSPSVDGSGLRGRKMEVGEFLWKRGWKA